MIWIVVLIVVAAVSDARLVFPYGSDVGYIVADDPEPDNFVNTKWLNELETDEDKSLLHDRGTRETLDQNAPVETWHGKWFPHPPKNLAMEMGAQKENLLDNGKIPESLKDDKHGVAMGKPHRKCDNGKMNLTVDWDNSPVNYTCFAPKQHRLPVLSDLSPVVNNVHLPRSYTPKHLCMYVNITYNTTLPIFGPHRPIWPVYGEYKFIPVQRWLHTLEHGGIVMLYDPCAEPTLVNDLRKLLTGCFRKHVITPYTLLTKERPLALLAWGVSMEMANVDAEEVKTFIKTHALHGPEGHYSRDGGYNHQLIQKAKFPPGAVRDSDICPE